jgi:hypothetical protein
MRARATIRTRRMSFGGKLPPARANHEHVRITNTCESFDIGIFLLRTIGKQLLVILLMEFD